MLLFSKIALKLLVAKWLCDTAFQEQWHRNRICLLPAGAHPSRESPSRGMSLSRALLGQLLASMFWGFLQCRGSSQVMFNMLSMAWTYCDPSAMS